jgi:hypothetical protein
MSDEISGEFKCVECHRHIVQVAGPVNQFHLCAMCMSLPGWSKDPILRKQLDPGLDEEDE